MKTKQIEDLKSKLLINCISKDETRRQLTGFCHVENIKTLCSTDGHRACLLKSRYNEELKNTIVCNKTFTVIEGEYPKISQVIPDIKNSQLYNLEIKKHHSAKNTNVYMYKNENNIYRDVKNAYLSFEVIADNEENYLCTFNSEFLKDLAKDITIKIAFFFT